ncbi:hypothetical protein [Calothrix sp. NIES-3974]|uniref:hypothetical protein n=1 Tax=Calothrix sp. NIES-3974 TaxID=2005462 RepID=UPI000B600361|nr:hypothetical protein [Calothrix sp. NIES-3974]BAZ04859.1 hypothetical protein NIES3974_15030 [Calothrix sp. NIES-3974]
MFSRNSPYHLKFPVWKYLNQPLFNPDTIINPRKFWRNYQRQYLQACWEIDPRLFLETCWQLDCLFYPDFISYALIEISLHKTVDNSLENTGNS